MLHPNDKIVFEDGISGEIRGVSVHYEMINEKFDCEKYSSPLVSISNEGSGMSLWLLCCSERVSRAFPQFVDREDRYMTIGIADDSSPACLGFHRPVLKGSTHGSKRCG